MKTPKNVILFIPKCPEYDYLKRLGIPRFRQTVYGNFDLVDLKECAKIVADSLPPYLSLQEVSMLFRSLSAKWQTLRRRFRLGCPPDRRVGEPEQQGSRRSTVHLAGSGNLSERQADENRSKGFHPAP